MGGTASRADTRDFTPVNISKPVARSTIMRCGQDSIYQLHPD